jgi:agmatine deiminase
MRRFGILLALMLLASSGFVLAEDTTDKNFEWDVDGLEKLLPRHETQVERDRWLGRESEMPILNLRDNPPTGPVRNCAEWEPTTGVMIRYPLGLPYNLLRDLDDNVDLHVVVSSGYLNTATSNLTANGVDMNRVHFLVRSNDSIWTRDYGPWFIFDAAGDLGIVNHTYNRPWRPNDNNIPLYFGQEQGIPVYSHSMYHTGGNYMTDGAHFSSSTRLVYNEAASENGMTARQVDDLMDEYYGVDQYHVLEYIESGGIHHVDTWAKFLDEENVLVKEVWSSHNTYSTLEQRATLLASLPASTGRNYQVHRVYCYSTSSGPASYTNSIILNDHIYVPHFGNSTYDEAALEVYRQAAPGYTVNGYYYSGFLSDDALHCRTKGIMDGGMLRVGHVPVRDEQEGAVTMTAAIVAHSGEALTSAAVHYRHDDGAWSSVDLLNVGDDLYEAVIPGPAENAICEYYIAVADASGRSEGMPRTQPAATYTFSHLKQVSAVGEMAPAAASLHANYPNPFNPSTTFSFELKYADEAELVIVDARGHMVRTLLQGHREAGRHEVSWDGTDESGRAVASGVYYYRLRAAGLQYTRAATLLK